MQPNSEHQGNTGLRTAAAPLHLLHVHNSSYTTAGSYDRARLVVQSLAPPFHVLCPVLEKEVSVLLSSRIV